MKFSLYLLVICPSLTYSLSTAPTSATLNTTTPTSASPTSTAITSQNATSTTISQDTTLVSSTATASQTSAAPPVDPSTLADMNVVFERRLSNIVGSLTRANDIGAWLSSLGSDGKWPASEVDYTTGCPARRANWPAQEHWQRIAVMAGAWHGGLDGAAQYVKDPTIHSAISSAMDWWFARDFTNPSCLDHGGTDACPCNDADTTLWNTNWFSNVILIPELVSQTCLLLNGTLTDPQLGNCTKMTARSYEGFIHPLGGLGVPTGANALDIAKIGIDLALFTTNASLITDAYRRIHLEMVITQGAGADGIRPDGSFGQHSGLLYNGNYGKDFTNDLLDLETESGNTQFAADSTAQNAFATLFDGDRWMIYYNTINKTLHWDFSALGRFISFPVIDNQATGSININLTKVGVLGEQWNSDIITTFSSSLSKGSRTANVGNLKGNRMFYDNDYMVQRGSNYVTTLKMYSTRTANTECTNSQNPLGFHLADGALYTYLKGNEYEDIAAAWDFNLIPGITTDYAATPLSCDKTRFNGAENFVGGASDGKLGIAAMKYTNPLSKSLHFQKAWFFLDNDVQHIMISNVSSTSSAPVLSVLDQKRRSGTIFATDIQNSVNITADSNKSFSRHFPIANLLWHDNVGYVLGNGTSLQVETGVKTGSWATIGTSTQPNATVDLFSASLVHDPAHLDLPVSYTAMPGISLPSFLLHAAVPSFHAVQNDNSISAVFDRSGRSAMTVFWDAAGGQVDFTQSTIGFDLSISSNANAAMMFNVQNGNIVVSDPSQTLQSVKITLQLGKGLRPSYWRGGSCKSLEITLPQSGSAGGSVAKKVQDSNNAC